MMLRRTALFIVAALFLLPVPLAKAKSGNDNLAEARALIEGMAQEAISVLSAKDRTDEQIKTKFHTLLSNGFDVDSIGRFVLGRYWRQATPQEQEEYLKAFEDYVVGIYANRFKEYSGESLAVTGLREVDGGDVLVASRIQRPAGGQPIQVDWKVRKTDAGWRVSDVVIEEVSMSISQRAEFASVIENNGGKVSNLIAQLKSRLAKAG
jgi:phospholipid transport system substrate-binding protein